MVTVRVASPPLGGTFEALPTEGVCLGSATSISRKFIDVFCEKSEPDFGWMGSLNATPIAQGGRLPRKRDVYPQQILRYMFVKGYVYVFVKRYVYICEKSEPNFGWMCTLNAIPSTRALVTVQGCWLTLVGCEP